MIYEYSISSYTFSSNHELGIDKSGKLAFCHSGDSSYYFGLLAMKYSRYDILTNLIDNYQLDLIDVIRYTMKYAPINSDGIRVPDFTLLRYYQNVKKTTIIKLISTIIYNKLIYSEHPEEGNTKSNKQAIISYLRIFLDNQIIKLFELVSCLLNNYSETDSVRGFLDTIPDNDLKSIKSIIFEYLAADANTIANANAGSYSEEELKFLYEGFIEFLRQYLTPELLSQLLLDNDGSTTGGLKEILDMCLKYDNLKMFTILLDQLEPYLVVIDKSATKIRQLSALLLNQLNDYYLSIQSGYPRFARRLKYLL
jgi:hypothetical protein